MKNIRSQKLKCFRLTTSIVFLISTIFTVGCGKFGSESTSLRVVGHLTGTVSIGTNSITLSEPKDPYPYGTHRRIYFPTAADSLKVTSSAMNPVTVVQTNTTLTTDFSTLQKRFVDWNEDLRNIRGDELDVGEVILIPVTAKSGASQKEMVASLSITSFKNQGDLKEFHESCAFSETQYLNAPFFEAHLSLNDSIENISVSIDTNLKIGLFRFYANPSFDCS
jgi:hypothetical protein